MAPIPRTMKSVSISKTGGVEVLDHGDVPVPTLKEGEVLVRNEFAGVNYIDTYFRSGLYPSPSFPLTLGREGAGQIVAAHASVTDSPQAKEGTRVVFMSTTGQGTYAEYTAVPASIVVPIPDGLSADKAAAAHLQGLTAWTFVREAAAVKEGQWTLVHAAAGGVGLLLVQMLRSVGAKVIGTASSDEKLELVKKNGADYTVNSKTEDLVARVKEITGGHGIDAIFDGIGKTTFDADIEMIALNGNLISFGNASGAVEPLSILRLGPKNIRLMRPIVNGYVSTRERLERYSAELYDLITSGKVDVRIHDVYPLAEAARAHTDIESRKTTGKLLIKI